MLKVLGVIAVLFAVAVFVLWIGLFGVVLYGNGVCHQLCSPYETFKCQTRISLDRIEPEAVCFTNQPGVYMRSGL